MEIWQFQQHNEEREMLLNGIELETLLDRLFEDDDVLNPEDVIVLKRQVHPPAVCGDCCTYNYSAYA